jgi:hypothetical protein
MTRESDIGGIQQVQTPRRRVGWTLAALVIVLTIPGWAEEALPDGTDDYRPFRFPSFSAADTVTAVSLLWSLQRDERDERRAKGFTFIGVGTYYLLSRFWSEEEGTFPDSRGKAMLAGGNLTLGWLILGTPSRAERAFDLLEVATTDPAEREDLAYAALERLARSSRRERYIAGTLFAGLSILAATSVRDKYNSSFTLFFGLGAIGSLLMPSREEQFLRRLEEGHGLPGTGQGPLWQPHTRGQHWRRGLASTWGRPPSDQL